MLKVSAHLKKIQEKTMKINREVRRKKEISVGTVVIQITPLETVLPNHVHIVNPTGGTRE